MIEGAKTIVLNDDDDLTLAVQTSLGTYQAEIYLDTMPITAQNVLNLARGGFYNVRGEWEVENEG